MSELAQLLAVTAPDLGAIARHLDALGDSERVAETRSLGRKHLSCLYDIAKGQRPITLGFVVDDTKPPMTEVVHHGKNSLGAFTEFQKVFVRPDGTHGEVLWGYNRTTSFVQTMVGPGYFVAYQQDPGEVLIDYLQVPPDKPADWPPIVTNNKRLSYFVYNGTQDRLRGVSEHVSIGRAYKGEKAMSAWFCLCRQD